MVYQVQSLSLRGCCQRDNGGLGNDDEATYERGFAGVFVKDRVPDEVQRAHTVLRRDLFGVATSVASRVLSVDLGGGVEGLVNIADVVDDHAQGERALVRLVRKVGRDLLSVCGLRGADLTLEELSEGREGLNDVDIRLREVKVVESGAWLVEVRLVDVVPVRLERVALALDVISESGALSEWVVFLLAKRRVVLLEDSQLGERGLEHLGVLLLENGLGAAGNCSNKHTTVRAT